MQQHIVLFTRKYTIKILPPFPGEGPRRADGAGREFFKILQVLVNLTPPLAFGHLPRKSGGEDIVKVKLIKIKLVIPAQAGIHV